MAATRRLTAILAADVAGYSRLMEADEEGTHERLQAHFQQLINPKVTEHHGRIVKTTGDGLLAEFASVVDAMRCAAEIQRGMIDRVPETPDERRIRFRIGINLGDVIAEGEDIFGDGVNVAARLEALAEPGGICVSGTVHDQIRDRLPYPLDDLGEQTVKNITRPVQVYALRPEAIANLPASRAPLPTSISEPAIAPHLSIVVLPFANLSDDREQQYFADGITEDLTTDLSRIAGSFVIARGTAVTFSGRAVDVVGVGRALGVRYVLEGSVRRLGTRVRVNAQLISAGSGGHVWAERFDVETTELSDLQDQVTGRIARALSLELVKAESERGLRERPTSPDAVDLTMRGQTLLNRMGGRESVSEARKLFEKAIELDPKVLDAWIGLAVANLREVNFFWSTRPGEQINVAEDAVAHALALDFQSSRAHHARATVLRSKGDFAAALLEYETVLALDRNAAMAYGNVGLIYSLLGDPEKAFAPIGRALALSPNDPHRAEWLAYRGMAQSMLQMDEEAAGSFQRAIAVGPDTHIYPYCYLAGTLALLGREAEARLAVTEILQRWPQQCISGLDVRALSCSARFVEWRERLYTALRGAGMPE